MRNWFTRAAAPGEAPLDAYKEGRADERAHLKTPALAREDHAAVTEAYDRGRREERLRRRGSPFLMFVTLVLVVVALAVLILALRAGSFAQAGAQIDATLRRPVDSAANQAGNALQNAGQTLKDKAGGGR